VCRSDHFEFGDLVAVRAQDDRSPSDRPWVRRPEVDDVPKLASPSLPPRDAVCSTRMICRRHGDFGAPSECRLSDTEIVRRDDQLIQFFRAPARFPNNVAVTVSCDRNRAVWPGKRVEAQRAE